MAAQKAKNAAGEAAQARSDERLLVRSNLKAPIHFNLPHVKQKEDVLKEQLVSMNQLMVTPPRVTILPGNNFVKKDEVEQLESIMLFQAYVDEGKLVVRIPKDSDEDTAVTQTKPTEDKE